MVRGGGRSGDRGRRHCRRPSPVAGGGAGENRCPLEDVLHSPEWTWSPPENLGDGVNSPFDDGSPFVSADGLSIVYRSNRPGGYGENDSGRAAGVRPTNRSAPPRTSARR